MVGQQSMVPEGKVAHRTVWEGQQSIETNGTVADWSEAAVEERIGAYGHAADWQHRSGLAVLERTGKECRAAYGQQRTGQNGIESYGMGTAAMKWTESHGNARERQARKGLGLPAPCCR